MSLSGPSQQLTESNLLEQLAHLKHSLCHCYVAHKGTCVSHWNWEGPQRVLRSITHSYSQLLQSLFSNKFSWKILVPISIETETEAFLLLLLSNQRLENRNRSCEWEWNKRKQRSEHFRGHLWPTRWTSLLETRSLSRFPEENTWTKSSLSWSSFCVTIYGTLCASVYHGS